MFVSAVAGVAQAFRVDVVDDSSVQLTRDAEGVRELHESADDTLAYLARRVAKRLEEYRKLSLDERLAHWETVHRVDLVVVRAGQAATVARGLVIHGYGLSPDGRTVAYSTTDKLVVVGIDGDRRREFVLAALDPRFTQYAIAPILWRPDGGALLFRAAPLGGRYEGGGEVFGDRECFVLGLPSGRLQLFRVEEAASVDWIAGGER